MADQMKWPAKTPTRYERVVDATTSMSTRVYVCLCFTCRHVTVQATSFSLAYTYTGWPRWWVDAGPPMTRAQPWEFAAVRLQLEMFCTVLIFGLTTKCMVNTKKSSTGPVSRNEKYRCFNDIESVLIFEDGWIKCFCCIDISSERCCLTSYWS